MSLTFESPSPAPVASTPGRIAPPVPAARGPPARSTPRVAPTPRLELSVGTAVTRYLALAVRAAGHRDPLRGQGQPAPGAAARAGRRPAAGSTSPARPRCGPRSTRAPGIRPRVLQPGHAARPPRRGVRARRAAVRRRLRRRGRQGRRGRARRRRCSCGIVTSGVGLGLAAVAQVRLLRRRGGRAARARPARSGLDPAGVSFHVGSQQRDPQAWDAPIASAARVFAGVRAAGLHPWLLDLGGGFPAAARRRAAAARRLRRAPSTRHLTAAFGARPPAHPRRARPRRRRRRRHGRHQRRRRRRPRRHPVGLPRRRASSPGWSRPSTRRSATGSRRPASPARPGRACSPGRPATAPTCSTRPRRSGCRWRSPRATSCASTPPAPTRRATRPSASTGSPRCPPSSPADHTDPLTGGRSFRLLPSMTG